MSNATRPPRYHPLIAKWLAEHKDPQPIPFQKRYDPLAKSTKDLTSLDYRRLELLDELIRDIEKRGARVGFGGSGNLVASIEGEDVEFRLRDKLKLVRRALTPEEKRWGLHQKDWKQEAESTGLLVFSIESYAPPEFRPQNWRTKWEENKRQSMETLLPEIASAILTAAIARREWTQKLNREKEKSKVAEQARLERRRARLVDKNRWIRLLEIAQEWRDAQLVHQMLTTIEQNVTDPEQMIGEKSVGEWLSWAKERASNVADGLHVFHLLDQVGESSYSSTEG